jgi:hypothetical protein
VCCFWDISFLWKIHKSIYTHKLFSQQCLSYLLCYSHTLIVSACLSSRRTSCILREFRKIYLMFSYFWLLIKTWKWSTNPNSIGKNIEIVSVGCQTSVSLLCVCAFLMAWYFVYLKIKYESVLKFIKTEIWSEFVRGDNFHF